MSVKTSSLRSRGAQRRTAGGADPTRHAGGESLRRRRRHPGFYTATGYGTPVAEGKEVRQLPVSPYILEEAITGDFASLLKAGRQTGTATLSIATWRKTLIR